MSTRYVWEKCAKKTVYENRVTSGINPNTNLTTGRGNSCNFCWGSRVTGITNSNLAQYGIYENEENIIVSGGTKKVGIEAGDYFLMADTSTGNQSVAVFETDDAAEITFSTNFAGNIQMKSNTTTTKRIKVPDTGKGSLQGYVSSGSSASYPQDGVSGANWYDYQGSDNIDPSGCSIPSTILGGSILPGITLPRC